MEFLKLRPLLEADAGTQIGAAQGAQPTGQAQVAPTPTAAQPNATDAPKFTQAELDKIIGATYAKFQTQFEKKAAELEEAKKLEKMSEADKQAHLLEQYKEKIAAYERSNLVNQYKVELSAKGIAADIAEFIPVADAEQAKKAVDALVKFKADTESALNAKIKCLEDELTKANLRQPSPKGVTPQETKTTTLKNIY